MSELGVDISPTKSHESNHAFELAKRWFYKGSEITPFPLNSLLEARENPSSLGAVLSEAIKKGWCSAHSQGIPSNIGASSLLKSLNYGKRSVAIRSDTVIDSYLFNNHRYTGDLKWVGERSMRDYASRHDPGQTMYDYKSLLQYLTSIVKSVKAESLKAMLAKAHKTYDKAGDAFSLFIHSLEECGLQPTAFSTIEKIPSILVLDRFKMRVMECVSKLGDVTEEDLKGACSLGSDLCIPDPVEIQTMRRSDRKSVV